MASSLFGLVFFGVLLFLPAGTLDYWQAWLFIAVFARSSRPQCVPGGAETRRFAASDACGTDGRDENGAEDRHRHHPLVAALLVVSALDHRFGWSQVPIPVVVLGDILVAVGLGIVMFVVIQNSYAAATITVEAEQTVVSTGLYRLVRHPMYVGTLIMMVGMRWRSTPTGA